MRTIDEIYSENSQYLHRHTLKARLEKAGKQDVTLVIKSVAPHKAVGENGRKKSGLLIELDVPPGSEPLKPWFCNKTNAMLLAIQHGKDFEQWVGKRVTLYYDPTVSFGREHGIGGIRVKSPQ